MSGLSGCATLYPTGGLYTNVTIPQDATSSTASSGKVGTSESMSVLGLVAIGDSGIDAAAANGGIKRIHHVDWEAWNILGVYGTYKAVVYGN